MVDKIEIILNNGAFKTTNLLILPNEEKCFFNNKEFPINEQKVKNILNILCTWKYEYGYNDKLIDCQEFQINVYSNKEKIMYHGKGEYPANFSEFLGIIGGIQDEK